MMRWTPEQVGVLRQMAPKGVAAIAVHFRISQSAVRRKANRECIVLARRPFYGGRFSERTWRDGEGGGWEAKLPAIRARLREEILREMGEA